MVMQIIIACALVEFIAEGIKGFLPKVKAWLISLALALVLCIAGKVEICSVIGLENVPSLCNQIITAVAISRGSSVLHEFFKKIQVLRQTK